MFPTRHAIQRFQERVAPVTAAEAARRIREAAASATIRTRPRWWTPVAPAAGIRFAYPHTLPGVCLLIREDAVITIFERRSCRRWHASRADSLESAAGRSQPYRRAAPGQRLEEAA